jgi:phage terminase large subunit-like protein
MSASVEQFAAFCATMTLDSGKAWEVEPFELDIVADILAGVPETWALLPEGNGKTTLLAGVALFHLLTVPRARVVVAAAASLQARILYDQCVGFVRDSPELSRRITVREGSLELRTAGGGRLKVYSADDRVADGAIFTLAIVDELHAHRGLGLYRTWGGKLSKRGGQLVILSTSGEPGTEFEELRSRLRTESPDVRKVGRYTRAAGPRHALHDWALESTDDPDDLALVKLANPLSTITLDVLTAKREQAGWQLGHWWQRTCNRAVRVVESWISEAEWERARSPRTIPQGAPIVLGVDWGWATDATAIVPLYCADGLPMLLGPATVLYAPAGDGLQLDHHRRARLVCGSGRASNGRLSRQRSSLRRDRGRAGRRYGERGRDVP